MKRLLIIILVVFTWAPVVFAQDNFETFRKKADADFENYRKNSNDEFEQFRKKINEEYAAMMEKAWKEFDIMAGRDIPENKVKPVPPVVYPIKDDNKVKPNPKPLPYDNVVPAPQPEPQPEPVVPIEEKPTPKIVPKVSFSFFGTKGTVRFDTSDKIQTDGSNEQNIARAWKAMSTDNYDNLVYDCLQLRKEEALCDWAYLEMLNCLASQIFGKNTNDATLLMAYIYCQSGYKMRLARDGSNKLYLLYASNHVIYDKNYFRMDGENFYPYGTAPKQLYICNATFPKENSMSLYVPFDMKLAERSSAPKTRRSERYPEVTTTMTSNLNLMDFYNTYPTSMIGDNFVTRWAMYANKPMSDDVKEQIYPSLRAAISGCSQLQAVEKLLNYVQTGFTYEYDDKVWGHDRAFFAEESLYYPYCDCEDRSILLTRIVRDLLGLKCILVYYPGHLASAIEFTDKNVSGDYISLDGHKYVIADGTYIGAPVGKTMPNMDNNKAKVILLE